MTQPVGHDDNASNPFAVEDVSVTAPVRRRKALTTEPEVSAAESLSPAAGLPDSDKIVATVRSIVGEQNYCHWFQRRTRMVAANDRLLVHVPNPFILNWLLKRFRTQLNSAAQKLLGISATCQLEVDSSLLHTEEGSLTAAVEPQSSAVDTTALAESLNADSRVTKSNGAGSGHLPVIGAANPFAQAKNGVVASAIPGGNIGRRKFRSFESFISGDCNSLAVMAARQVASTPGERFNPLYIYGGTGTGKTHLLEAVYADVRRRRPTSQVMYLSSEGFTNYFTSALASRTVPSFRQRFRNVDVLLIDNVEFLDNKRATQEEFLHTIVQVTEHGGQVVVSADRHPRMLTKHRDELTTRFMGGLVCRIETPDETTSLAVARSIATTLTAKFSDDVLEYVARRCRRNIREIQGALNSLDGQFSLSGRRISLHVAREVLGELTQECNRLIRISDVERIVCDAFGVTAADLRSPTRRKAISLPRAIAMFIARRMTKSAYREIGLYFGGRDHSTVVAAEKRVAELVSTDAALNLPSSCNGRTVTDVIEELQSRLMSLAS